MYFPSVLIFLSHDIITNSTLLRRFFYNYSQLYNKNFPEILIKENHIVSDKNIKNLINKALKTKKIVTVEVENINQLKQVLGLKFKRILFDNMNLKQLRMSLKLCKNKYETEYSGNADLKNILKISRTGISRISIGSLTHSPKSFDSSLLI